MWLSENSLRRQDQNNLEWSVEQINSHSLDRKCWVFLHLLDSLVLPNPAIRMLFLFLCLGPLVQPSCLFTPFLFCAFFSVLGLASWAVFQNIFGQTYWQTTYTGCMLSPAWNVPPRGGWLLPQCFILAWNTRGKMILAPHWKKHWSIWRHCPNVALEDLPWPWLLLFHIVDNNRYGIVLMTMLGLSPSCGLLPLIHGCILESL